MAEFKRVPGSDTVPLHEPPTVADWIGSLLGGVEISEFTLAMAAATLVLLVLLIVLRLVRREPEPQCDWRVDDEREAEAGYTAWICLECGVEGQFPDDAPPAECWRDAVPAAS